MIFRPDFKAVTYRKVMESHGIEVMKLHEAEFNKKITELNGFLTNEQSAGGYRGHE